jgi:hypothetical protein
MVANVALLNLSLLDHSLLEILKITERGEDLDGIVNLVSQLSFTTFRFSCLQEGRHTFLDPQ